MGYQLVPEPLRVSSTHAEQEVGSLASITSTQVFMGQSLVGKARDVDSTAGPHVPRANHIPPELRTGLKQARRRVFDALASLSAAGLAMPEEIQTVRGLIRRGRELRLATPMSIRSAIRACDDFACQLERRLGTAAPQRSKPASLARARSSRRSPRTVRRRTLAHIPAAGTTPTNETPADREPPRLPLIEVAENAEFLEEIAARMQLVALMDADKSASQALQALGLPASRRRFAQRLHKKWKQTGTVIDGRWTRYTDRHVMTPELQAIVLKVWNGRRGASIAAVHRMTCKEVQRRRKEAAERGTVCTLEEPSYPSVRNYIRDLPPALKLVRDESLAAWDKNARLVVKYDPTRYSNEMNRPGFSGGLRT